MTEPSARVILDSISPYGSRLTTMEVLMHRYVLAEFNTHRVFSRNSASSRAIPFPRQLELMEELGIAYPISWPREQKGMQGGEEFEDGDLYSIRRAWSQAADTAVIVARALHGAGLHKSVVNRLLEPFMWHRVIVSSTEWDNFFAQRCSPLAQPEIRAVAEAMRTALNGSEPQEVAQGQWHMPYMEREDLFDCQRSGEDPRQVSAARCARVSYLTHDKRRDVQLDVDLYQKLVSADPPHASPLEHVATPNCRVDGVGNFLGWTQLRHQVIMGL
jgi:hypothetical protein